PKINCNRNTREIKVLTQFVYDETLVRIFSILRKIAEKSKTWIRRGQLCTEVNFHVFRFVSVRRIMLNNRKDHLIQFAGLYFFTSVLVNLNSSFNSFINTLFC